MCPLLFHIHPTLALSEMEGVGAQDELLNDIRNNKAKQDELLRDLLICLVRKYRVEEAKRSPAAKLRMWNDLSREYHRLSGVWAKTSYCNNVLFKREFFHSSERFLLFPSTKR